MKQIIVCGWVRCGNQWLQRLFQCYFGWDMEVKRSHLPVANHFDHDIRWDRQPGEICDTYLIHTQRDLRDAFVSWYYLLFTTQPRVAGNWTFNEYLLWLTTQRTAPLRNHIESWLKLEPLQPDNVLWTSHERACADRAGELRRMVSEMGYPVDEKRIALAAHILEVEPPRLAYTGQGPVQETKRTEPRGIPGMWKTHFDAKGARIVEDFCGDLIRRLGYGGDPDWERLLEKTE